MPAWLCVLIYPLPHHPLVPFYPFTCSFEGILPYNPQSEKRVPTLSAILQPLHYNIVHDYADVK